ncbi:uncharacterized protein LOC114183671 isoform X4 [Vigna unguiculata]|uniref:uncharacterized protein LOC114183671 isoform X4 n=1 Tax=Vigna unguiculata TaxID=3917 RepID=UPI00101683AA|nr:uncharacterized protein LOC114183671 isoform X4 [Vigna unguiculata]XP_027926570.1 uncharacterized protein LOC114183671 isoform X4 [Vigna unguiculata]
MDAGSLSSSGALKDRMTLSSSRTVYSKKEFPKKCCQTSLANTIVNQIDYYFNDANLVRDEYLRFNMDEQRWVPISLIASFLVLSSDLYTIDDSLPFILNILLANFVGLLGITIILCLLLTLAIAILLYLQ